MKKLSKYFCLLALVVACTSDEINISMTPNDANPIFRFEYVRKPTEAVSLTSLTVEESETGHLIWELSSFDPSLIFEKKGDKLVPRDHQKVPYEKLKSVELTKLSFGEVPSGFEQYYPPQREAPALQRNIKYIIHVVSGAGQGRMEFTLDGVCRRISLTTFTSNSASFNKAGRC